MASSRSILLMFTCFIFMTQSGKEFKEYPACPDGKPDEELIRCLKQKSGKKLYECKIRFNEECPDYDDESQKHPFWFEEKKPSISRVITHHLWRKGFKICSYEKNCADLSELECQVQQYLHYHSRFIDYLPDHEAIAFTLYPQGLTNYKYMKPKEGDSDQHQHDLQYHLGQYHEGTNQDTLVIYFDGTDARMIDLRTDLSVAHTTHRLQFSLATVALRVHQGIVTRLQDFSFWDGFLKELIKRYGGQQPPKKLVISGHSLGGGYAIWFYLMVFSEQNPHNVWRNRKGMNIFNDMHLEDITVITYGAPFIIYYKDIYRVPEHVQDRIFNFVDFKDPVPKSLAGVNRPLLKSMSITGLVRKSMKRAKIIKVATNGPVGNFIMIYHHDGHVWMESLERNEPVIRFGSICFWYQITKGRHLKEAMALAKETHMEDKYRKRIMLGLASAMGSMDALRDDPQNGYFKQCLNENEDFRKTWDTLGKEFTLMNSRDGKFVL